MKIYFRSCENKDVVFASSDFDNEKKLVMLSPDRCFIMGNKYDIIKHTYDLTDVMEDNK